MGRPSKPTHLKDLTPDQQNARRHTPRNLGLIVQSIHEVGAARSGVIDEDGKILAGNATWEALAEAGIERVKVVDASGDEWVVVRRSGLTEAQKRRLSLLDNRTAELGEWNEEILYTLSQDTPDLLKGLWREEELVELLTTFQPTSEDAQPRLDEKAKVTCPKCGHEFTP